MEIDAGLADQVAQVLEDKLRIESRSASQDAASAPAQQFLDREVVEEAAVGQIPVRNPRAAVIRHPFYPEPELRQEKARGIRSSSQSTNDSRRCPGKRRTLPPLRHQ